MYNGGICERAKKWYGEELVSKAEKALRSVYDNQNFVSGILVFCESAENLARIINYIDANKNATSADVHYITYLLTENPEEASKYC